MVVGRFSRITGTLQGVSFIAGHKVGLLAGCYGVWILDLVWSNPPMQCIKGWDDCIRFWNHPVPNNIKATFALPQWGGLSCLLTDGQTIHHPRFWLRWCSVFSLSCLEVEMKISRHSALSNSRFCLAWNGCWSRMFKTNLLCHFAKCLTFYILLLFSAAAKLNIYFCIRLSRTRLPFCWWLEPYQLCSLSFLSFCWLDRKRVFIHVSKKE